MPINLPAGDWEAGERGIACVPDRIEEFRAGVNRAIDIIESVGADNLGIQYDIYHMQTMGEDTANILPRYLERIHHIQIADAPGRHEPGSGGIDYRRLFDEIERSGYDGWVGCEYLPAGDTAKGLAWVDRYGLEL